MSLSLPRWEEKEIDAKGRGWQGEAKGKSARHRPLRLTCYQNTVGRKQQTRNPCSLGHIPSPLMGQSPHLKTPRPELANLSHPPFLRFTGYSMTVLHKHWSGAVWTERFKAPFALKEFNPCPHHCLMN